MESSTGQKQNPLRIMVDTNIHDKIECDETVKELITVLVKTNKIKFLTTHIQIDELSAVNKSANLFEEQINTAGSVIGPSKIGKARIGDGSPKKNHKGYETEIVPTAGAVWGVSIWGLAKWGDGSQGGISIDDIKTSAGKHAKDALISTTASLEVDIFVTEDKKLLKRLNKLPTQCEVLNYENFKARLMKITQML